MCSVPALTHRLPPLNPPAVLSLAARSEAELPRNRRQVCVRLDSSERQPGPAAWPQRGVLCLAGAALASSPPGPGTALGAARAARPAGPARDGACTAQRTRIRDKIGSAAHQRILLTEHLEIELISWVDVSRMKPHILQIYS